MKIIAFCGHKENGKTTSANYIMNRIRETSEQPVLVERINFKDSIVDEMVKNMPQILGELSVMYGMTIDELFKNKPVLMRKLMQDYGLFRRDEEPGYWVKKFKHKVSNSSANYVIVDDLRFCDEWDVLNKLGAKVYKIVREGLENTDHHATEKEIDLIEAETITAKDKEDLFNQLDQIRL